MCYGHMPSLLPIQDLVFCHPVCLAQLLFGPVDRVLHLTLLLKFWTTFPSIKIFFNLDSINRSFVVYTNLVSMSSLNSFKLLIKLLIRSGPSPPLGNQNNIKSFSIGPSLSGTSSNQVGPDVLSLLWSEGMDRHTDKFKNWKNIHNNSLFNTFPSIFRCSNHTKLWHFLKLLVLSRTSANADRLLFFLEFLSSSLHLLSFLLSSLQHPSDVTRHAGCWPLP